MIHAEHPHNQCAFGFMTLVESRRERQYASTRGRREAPLKGVSTLPRKISSQRGPHTWSPDAQRPQWRLVGMMFTISPGDMNFSTRSRSDPSAIKSASSSGFCVACAASIDIRSPVWMRFRYTWHPPRNGARRAVKRSWPASSIATQPQPTGRLHPESYTRKRAPPPRRPEPHPVGSNSATPPPPGG